MCVCVCVCVCVLRKGGREIERGSKGEQGRRVGGRVKKNCGKMFLQLIYLEERHVTVLCIILATLL